VLIDLYKTFFNELSFTLSPDAKIPLNNVFSKSFAAGGSSFNFIKVYSLFFNNPSKEFFSVSFICK